MAFKTGADGKVVVGATTLTIIKWTFDSSVEFVDTTHSQSQGCREQIPAVKQATVAFEAEWDFDPHPIEDPPNLNPGEQVAMKLYFDNDNYINIPKADITSLPTTLEVADKIIYTCNAKVNGAWSYVTA